MDAGFQGFPKQGLEFLYQLGRNNNKPWFAEHKKDYETCLVGPARLFILDLGARLQTIVPELTFDPRTNKSLFRIYRDVRFSREKSPYKTHLGIWLWEGSRKKLENSGFYFHLEHDHILLASGLYGFPPDLLARYRKAVDNEKSGEKLVKLVAEIEKNPDYEVGGDALKRAPRGYGPDHPRARFMKYKGFGPMLRLPATDVVHKRELLDLCFNEYQTMLPLHQWLVEYVL